MPPIYEYKCSNCGESYDILQKLDEPDVTICNMCGHSSMVKQFSAPNFRIQGGGVDTPSLSDGHSSD